MSDVAVVETAVEKVVQVSDPMVIANELAGLIGPLLKSMASSELDSRHEIGKLLNARLKPNGQKRLSYGGKVMDRLSEELNIARSTLNRMSQFADQFQTLADFQAKHPDVTNWTQVKIVLVKPKSANQHSTDLTKVHLQQCLKSLATYRDRFAKNLNGSHASLIGECRRAAQELMEMLDEHLSTNSTAA